MFFTFSNCTDGNKLPNTPQISVDNYEVYSFELQSKFLEQLETTKDNSVKRSDSSFMLFHVGVYVFVISVLKSGEYIVYEKHPISAVFFQKEVSYKLSKKIFLTFWVFLMRSFWWKY